MSWLDRLVGLDDERARGERAPLWKRAVWRALKSLVRKHPGAAVSAAGTAAGYAVTQGVEEGAEAVKEGVESGLETIKEKARDVEAALVPHAAPAALPPPAKAPPGEGKPGRELEIAGEKSAAGRETEEALGEAAADATEEAAAVHGAAQRVHRLTQDEKRELVDALSPEDRRTLAELAKKI